MLSSKANGASMRRGGGVKQAPPIGPGIKRFKTQTKDKEKQPVSEVSVSNAIRHEDGLETSSFAEDPSIHVIPVESSTGSKLAQLPLTLGYLQGLNGGQADEMAKFSDTGLKELSIVESDGEGHETPACDRKQGSFNSSIVEWSPRRKSILPFQFLLSVLTLHFFFVESKAAATSKDRTALELQTR